MLPTHPGDTQKVELLGRNRLIDELLRDNLEVAMPIRDRGIDLIAYVDLGEGVTSYTARPIQMKASWTRAFGIDRKYEKFPDLILAYVWNLGDRDQAVTFAMSREDVQRMAEASLAAVPAPLQVSTAFLLLTLGLRENSDAAANMVLRNFFTVHSALATGAHSSESWWLISPELPALRWWRDWDRCEKLRQAVHFSLSQRGACKRLREFAKTSDEKKIARKVAENDSDESLPKFLD